MKKILKKSIAIIICTCLILSTVSIGVLAQKNVVDLVNEKGFASQTGLNMIANNLTSGEDSGDYSIVYLDINDKTATVELNNKEDCTLVVAIYEEGSAHMLASGVKEISANAGLVEVKINVDTMPKTYLAKAFLLGADNYALCKEYVSYKHTKAYLEFLEKEPEDFEGKNVVVFDDIKEQTDFGVLNDSVIFEDSTENMTFSFDETNGTYTFENAGDDLKKLAVGDVYYYQFGEKSNEYVLFKAESVSVSGSSVTVVQNKNIALSEAFSFIRVDSYGDYSDISAEDFTYGSALTPIGSALKARNIVYEENGTNEWETSASLNYTLGEISGGTTSAEISATVGYKLKVHVELYYDPVLFGKDFYEFKSEITNTFTIAGLNITGKISLPEDKVNIKSPPVPVGPFTLSIGAAPIVSASASLSGGANVVKKLTVTADNTNGIDKSATSSTDFKPEFDDGFEVKFGAKIYATLAFTEIVKLEPSVSGGVEFTGDLDVVGVLADKHHDCYTCVDCESNVFINGSFTLKVIIIPEIMDFEWPFVDLTKTWHLYDFYISLSSDGFKTDKGDCPNIRYRALVKVKDEKGNNLSGVTVKCASGVCDSNGDGKFNETSIDTDANGEAIFYLKKGAHYFTAEKVKYLKAETDVTVIQSSKYVPITMKEDKLYNVTLKITDKDGNPLSSATFYSETAYYDVDGDAVNEKTSAVTGLDGMATLQFSEGVHTVSASCNGYETKIQQTIVTEDKTFTIKLDKIEYYNLSVAVKDEEGNAISDASVTVTGDADNDGTDETETSTTNSSGNAAFKLKSASWDVTVSKEDYYSKTVTVIWLNEDKDLEVMLEKDNSLKAGNLIEFGSYPQSEVTDEALIADLNASDGEWISYGYYSGTGNWWDNGQMKPGDYMRYKDVVLGSDKYRGVVFDAYRPTYTRSEATTDGLLNTYQDDNCYTYGNVYWFKYEPIEWRVLDPATGMVMAETILDSQTYSNYVLCSGDDGYNNDAYWGDSSKTYYANNYAESSIRQWLNDAFYSTAFSAAQQNMIEYTEVDNTCDSHPAYNSETTYDKIYLLSYDDTLNMDYGFNPTYNVYDTARNAQGSDYAKCQGLYVSSSDNYNGNSSWRLRTGGYSSDRSCWVDYNGDVNYRGGGVDNSGIGIRPALNLNLKSLTSESDEISTASTFSLSRTAANAVNTQAVEAIKKSAEGVISFTEKNAVASNDYILLNVKDWGEGFRLKNENLFFIDRVTADENGAVSISFTPSEYHSDSVTLLIGDFGNGIEAREITPSVKIKNNNGSKTINYGETLRLTVITADIPAGVKIYWYVDGLKKGEGETFNISFESGTKTVEVKLVDENGNILMNANGNEISDSERVTIKAGFFQKLISFFKNLFGVNRTVVQLIKPIF